MAVKTLRLPNSYILTIVKLACVYIHLIREKQGRSTNHNSTQLQANNKSQQIQEKNRKSHGEQRRVDKWRGKESEEERIM